MKRISNQLWGVIINVVNVALSTANVLHDFIKYGYTSGLHLYVNLFTVGGLFISIFVWSHWRAN